MTCKCNQLVIIFDKTESILQSFIKDFITFGFLFLCIWVSQESAFYTLVTGCMFFIFVAIKSSQPSNDCKKFTNITDLKEYVNKL